MVEKYSHYSLLYLELQIYFSVQRLHDFDCRSFKGRKAKEIIESQRSVVEGYKTAKAAKLLADKYEIRARIFHGVYEVLYEERTPAEIISAFMKLSPRFEID